MPTTFGLRAGYGPGGARYLQQPSDPAVAHRQVRVGAPLAGYLGAAAATTPAPSPIIPHTPLKFSPGVKELHGLGAWRVFQPSQAWGFPGRGRALQGFLGEVGPTGGTQMDTGGTQAPGQSANPVMTVIGTDTSILPSAQPTILSTGVQPIGATPQSPLPMQGQIPLAVSDGGFIPPQFPAPAPAPSPFASTTVKVAGSLLLLLAAGAYMASKHKH
jgi:hypothetical protein